jgi:hypothetical protein
MMVCGMSFFFIWDFEMTYEELLPLAATFAPLSVSLLSTPEMGCGAGIANRAEFSHSIHLGEPPHV